MQLITTAWFENWQESLKAWWLLTPFRDGLRACFHALGAFLARHLQWSVRLWQMERQFVRKYGRFNRPKFGANALSPPPPLGGGDECEWVNEKIGSTEMGLPDFPEAPKEFREWKLPPHLFPVPIPGLMPDESWINSLDRSPADGGRIAADSGRIAAGGGRIAAGGGRIAADGGRIAAAYPTASARHAESSSATPSSTLLAAGIAAGFGIGVGALMLMRHLRPREKTMARATVRVRDTRGLDTRGSRRVGKRRES